MNITGSSSIARVMSDMCLDSGEIGDEQREVGLLRKEVTVVMYEEVVLKEGAISLGDANEGLGACGMSSVGVSLSLVLVRGIPGLLGGDSSVIPPDGEPAGSQPQSSLEPALVHRLPP